MNTRAFNLLSNIFFNILWGCSKMLIFENKTLLERVVVCLCDIIPDMRTTIFHSGASYEMKCLFFLSMIFSYLF